MTFGVIVVIMLAAVLNLFHYDYAWVALASLILAAMLDAFAMRRR